MSCLGTLILCRYAIEFNNKIRLNMLIKNFRSPGIPHLVILNYKGRVLSTSGTSDMQTYGDNALDYWKSIENS